MGDHIQIEPMKWGTCFNCKSSLDEMGGPMLVFCASNPDDLKAIHCKDCLYELWRC